MRRCGDTSRSPRRLAGRTWRHDKHVTDLNQHGPVQLSTRSSTQAPRRLCLHLRRPLSISLDLRRPWRHSGSRRDAVSNRMRTRRPSAKQGCPRLGPIRSPNLHHRHGHSQQTRVTRNILRTAPANLPRVSVVSFPKVRGTLLFRRAPSFPRYPPSVLSTLDPSVFSHPRTASCPLLFLFPRR